MLSLIDQFNPFTDRNPTKKRVIQRPNRAEEFGDSRENVVYGKTCHYHSLNPRKKITVRHPIHGTETAIWGGERNATGVVTVTTESVLWGSGWVPKPYRLLRVSSIIGGVCDFYLDKVIAYRLDSNKNCIVLATGSSIEELSRYYSDRKVIVCFTHDAPDELKEPDFPGYTIRIPNRKPHHLYRIPYPCLWWQGGSCGDWLSALFKRRNNTMDAQQ